MVSATFFPSLARLKLIVQKNSSALGVVNGVVISPVFVALCEAALAYDLLSYIGCIILVVAFCSCI